MLQHRESTPLNTKNSIYAPSNRAYLRMALLQMRISTVGASFYCPEALRQQMSILLSEAWLPKSLITSPLTFSFSI
jgi:hypothetical protein